MRAASAWALAVVGGSLLAVWGTWPLGAHLSTHVYDPTRSPGILATAVVWDIHHDLWNLAWDAHAFATAPFSLFDANVFHPAGWTLAGSDHMLGALPLYPPGHHLARSRRGV